MRRLGARYNLQYTTVVPLPVAVRCAQHVAPQLALESHLEHDKCIPRVHVGLAVNSFVSLAAAAEQLVNHRHRRHGVGVPACISQGGRVVRCTIVYKIILVLIAAH